LHSPEIDGAGAITAGAMLAGILALVGERRRRKDL
jgi:MYXO-CTERM domain-containing protein